jgi:hypothetical protein
MIGHRGAMTAPQCPPIYRLSIGCPAVSQPLSPPISAETFVNPFWYNFSAAPALVCSLGQVQ